MTKNMTQGEPMRVILEFSIPVIFGLLFQQFYNFADTLIVGRYLGVDALAAVGSTGSVNQLVTGLCSGICNGFAIPLANRFGAGDEHGARAFVVNALYLTAIFAIVTAVVTVALCRPILQLTQTPEDVIDDAYVYLVIILAGIPATYLYNTVAAIIRAMGDSKTPLIFLTASVVLNVALDLLFVIGIHLGVAGAALATVISQAVSGIACLVYGYSKFPILHMDREDRALDGKCMKILCCMGIPMGLQYSITSIGSVILQSAINTLGTTAIVARSTGSTITTFFHRPFNALGSAISVYGGQNVGAGKPERIPQGLKACSVLGIVYSVIAFIILLFAGGYLAMFFVGDASAEVIAYTHKYLIVNAVFYVALLFVLVLRSLVQGMGYSGLAMFTGIFELVARAFVGLALVPVFGFTAVCFSGPLAWILADAFLFPVYFYALKKTKQALAVSK